MRRLFLINSAIWNLFERNSFKNDTLSVCSSELLGSDPSASPIIRAASPVAVSYMKIGSTEFTIRTYFV